MRRRPPAIDPGRIGSRFSRLATAARPDPLEELRAWGGASIVRRKRVLDLGCGDGRLALGIASIASSVDALDPDPDAIAGAKKRARSTGIRNARFAIGAAQKMPYRDGSFDVVILSWSL
jgi:ubiquinone/menaquinone biosynthesis C-methylase UbiE